MANFAQWKWKASKACPGRALVLLWGLVMITTLGTLGCKSSSHAPDATKKDSHAPQVKAVMHLESFVVNLADPEENRFLRVGIDLGLENPVTAKEGKEGEGQVPTARIRDCILEVLSTWHSDALLAPEGKQKLKDELVKALRARAPELGVKEVYFTDFLVQR
jgi:flagellar FliL protein